MVHSNIRAALALLAAVALIAAACRPGEETVIDDPGEIRTGTGIVDGRLQLGQLSPMTGPVALIGEPLTRGHEVYFEYVNEELGGIGRNLDPEDRFPVDLLVRDTQYLTDIHVEQYSGIRDQVLAIPQSLGTPTTKAILPQLNEDGILTGAATLSSDWLHEPFIVTLGAPYLVQFVNAAHYLVEELGESPTAGIIFQDDDYGLEGVKGAEHAAEEFDFEIAAQATYTTGDTEFAAQVTAMRNADVDTVFLTATPGEAARIWGTAAAMGYTPRWIAQSPTWVEAVFKNPDLAPYLQEHVWWVSDAACEWGETGPGCEGMEEMLENIDRFRPDQDPDFYFQFGYTQAKVFHEILELAVERGDLTRQGVIDAFNEMRNVDIGGLLNPVSYGPTCEERIPVTASAIFEVDPELPVAVRPIAEVDSPAVDTYPFC